MFLYKVGLVGVRKGTLANDGKAVGPGQVFKILFVSKMKKEGMVGNESHINLGFLREGGGAVGHLSSSKGEREKGICHCAEAQR